jgi:hypothetical protein
MASDDDKFQQLRAWYDRKSSMIEASLGKQHNVVMHAIIAYEVGGALDLYYYPDALPRTAIATKELSQLPDEGPSNSVYDCYELVMFTKHRLNLDQALDETTDFGKAHASIDAILNRVARYSADATLNPHATFEFSDDMERVGGKCLIFDGYASHTDGETGKTFGLLALIEVFRSEMEYARRKGAAKLIKRLKAKGHYPYSDLDRKPVA